MGWATFCVIFLTNSFGHLDGKYTQPRKKRRSACLRKILVKYSVEQGCQMVYFQTQISSLVYFGEPWFM
jgi:hypothetical protein